MPRFYTSQNRRDDARSVLTTLAAEPNGRDAADVQLAALDYAERKHAEAYKKVDGVLGRAPKDVDALLLKARFLLEDGKYDDAASNAQAAVAANPQFATAHYVLGTIYLQQKNSKGAFDAFTEVLKLNPRVSGGTPPARPARRSSAATTSTPSRLRRRRSRRRPAASARARRSSAR